MKKLLAVMAFLLTPGLANAIPIIFEFSGTAHDVLAVPFPGESFAFSGRYTFDSEAIGQPLSDDESELMLGSLMERWRSRSSTRA
jgi:hypothetical protein